MVFLLRSSALSVAIAALFLQSSEAHVHFSNETVKPNTVLNTALGVPHGCSGSDTIGISITAPENIDIGIVPQNVQNWTLTVNYRDSSNKTVKDFAWTGGYIPHDGKQEFGVTLNIPQVDLSQKPNVTALFPTIQTCLNSTSNWTSDPSAPGYNATRGDKPAPQIVITNEEPAPEDHSGHGSASAKPSSSTSTNGAMTFFAQGSALPLAAAGLAIAAGMLL